MVGWSGEVPLAPGFAATGLVARRLSETSRLDPKLSLEQHSLCGRCCSNHFVYIDGFYSHSKLPVSNK